MRHRANGLRPFCVNRNAAVGRFLALSKVILLEKFFRLLTAFGAALIIACCAEAAVVKITVENVRVGRGNLHLLIQ